MPTVIDTLVVALKLDSKDLDSRSGTAGKRLKDLESQGAKTSGEVKKLGDTSKQAASGIGELTAGFTKFLAVLGGTVALKAFIEDTIDSSAALSRLSKNLNESVEDVSAWGNAVEGLGGSAKGLQSSLGLLSKAQTDIKVTGDSSLIPYLSLMGVSLADAGGKARKTTDILESMAGWAEGRDRQTAHNVFTSLGFDEGTINLLLLGRKELELNLKRQKEFNAVTKAQAEESAKLQKSLITLRQSFTALGRDLLQQASPAIEKFLNILTGLGDWIKSNLEFIKDLGKVLGVIGGAVTVIAAITSPFAAIIAGVVALGTAIALLWQDYQTWKRGGDTLIDWEKWKPGIDAAKAAILDLAKIVKESFGAIFDDVGAVQKLMHGDWRGALGAAKKSDDHVRAAFGAAISHGVIGGVAGVAIKAAPATRKAIATANGQQVTDAYAMQYFMDRGFSKKDAAALASQIHSESGGKVNNVGDHGNAYGLIQWHQPRQDNFRKLYGHDIQHSTADEQLAFMVHELKVGTERPAAKKLAEATTAEQKGEALSKYYVRPRDVEGEARRRGAYAQTLAGIGGASSNLAAAGRPVSASTTTSSDNSTTVTNNVGQLTIQTQATDANGIARSFKNGLDSIFSGYANAGLQ